MLNKFVAKTLLLSILALAFSLLLTVPAPKVLATPQPTPTPAPNCWTVNSNQTELCLYNLKNSNGETEVVYVSKVLATEDKTSSTFGRWKTAENYLATANITQIKVQESISSSALAKSYDSAKYDLYQIGMIDKNMDVLVVETSTAKVVDVISALNKTGAYADTSQSLTFYKYIPPQPGNVRTAVWRIYDQLKSTGAALPTSSTETSDPVLYSDGVAMWFDSPETLDLVILNSPTNGLRPVISVPAKGNRPEMRYYLKHVVLDRKKELNDDNFFYFFPETSPIAGNDSALAIRIDMKGNAKLVRVKEIVAKADDVDVAGVTLTLDKTSYLNSVINFSYNKLRDDPTSFWDFTLGILVPGYTQWDQYDALFGEKCGELVKFVSESPANQKADYTGVGRTILSSKTDINKGSQIGRCLSKDGWLTHWDVEVTTEIDKEGTPPADQCIPNTVCKDKNGKVTKDIVCSINQAMCTVAFMFHNWFEKILEDAQLALTKSIGFGGKCE